MLLAGTIMVSALVHAVHLRKGVSFLSPYYKLILLMIFSNSHFLCASCSLLSALWE